MKGTFFSILKCQSGEDVAHHESFVFELLENEGGQVYGKTISNSRLQEDVSGGQRGSIGFQFLISWRIPVTLSLLTPSMSGLLKDRKPMTSTSPGLLICLNGIQSKDISLNREPIPPPCSVVYLSEESLILKLKYRKYKLTISWVAYPYLLLCHLIQFYSHQIRSCSFRSRLPRLTAMWSVWKKFYI